MIRSVAYILRLSMVLLCFSSCTKELGYADYKSYLYDGVNGLCKEVVWSDTRVQVTYWPTAFSRAIGLTQDPIIFFEIKSDNPEFILFQDESSFRLNIDDTEYSPLIVFPENKGFEGDNRLLVGFNDPGKKGDMELILLSRSGRPLDPISFDKRSIKNVPPLKKPKQ